jgi:hypothetical protein
MKLPKCIRSVVCIFLCAVVATVVSVCTVCTKCDEQQVQQPRRVVDRLTISGTDWWYEGLPPEWYQPSVDPFEDQAESVISIATVPELIQDAMNSEEVVPFVGQ